MSASAQPESKKKRRSRLVRALNADIKPIEDLLEKLGVDSWDYLLVGDGSGFDWKLACGWGCVSVDALRWQPRLWYGAMNYGTVNLAEMLAYLQPLSWIAKEERKLRKGKLLRFAKVHIFTDSQYCRGQGDSVNLQPKCNGALWQVFADFRRHGLLLHWHWLERERLQLNRYADALSKAMRKLIDAQDVRATVERGAPNSSRRV